MEGNDLYTSVDVQSEVDDLFYLGEDWIVMLFQQSDANDPPPRRSKLVPKLNN